MSKDDYMRRAIELSRIGMETGQGGPFGAVIVRDGKIIGEGHNLVLATNDPTAHGEIVAIRDAAKRVQNFSLDGAEIYTSCEPCPMCLAAIHWARIGYIYYGNTADDAAAIGFDDALIYSEMGKPKPQRLIKSARLLNDEAAAVFKIWAKKTTVLIIRVGKKMGIIIDIMDRVKYRLGKADEPAPPRQDDSVNDTAAGEEDSSGNPILDLYNRAVTHPVTTIGLIAAVVGVGAAAAFVLAERQAQKGIERELARKSARAGQS